MQIHVVLMYEILIVHVTLSESKMGMIINYSWDTVHRKRRINKSNQIFQAIITENSNTF